MGVSLARIAAGSRPGSLSACLKHCRFYIPRCVQPEAGISPRAAVFLKFYLSKPQQCLRVQVTEGNNTVIIKTIHLRS